MSIIDKILRAGEGRMLRKLDRLASQVDAMQEDFEALTDEELQAKTQEFKDRLEEGETLDDILVEAFATVREASWRILRMRPFHVQVMGGIAVASEHRINRIWRDLRVDRISGGTDEMMILTTAKNALKKYRQ